MHANFIKRLEGSVGVHESNVHLRLIRAAESLHWSRRIIVAIEFPRFARDMKKLLYDQLGLHVVVVGAADYAAFNAVFAFGRSFEGNGGWLSGLDGLFNA